MNLNCYRLCPNLGYLAPIYKIRTKLFPVAGYRIQKMLGLAACLLAGRVVELRPGPGSSRPKYLCCTLAPHLPDWNSASPAYPMVKKPVSC